MKKVAVLLLAVLALSFTNCSKDDVCVEKYLILKEVKGKSQSWTLCLNGETVTYSNYNAYINVLNNNPNATDGACETLSNTDYSGFTSTGKYRKADCGLDGTTFKKNGTTYMYQSIR